MYYAHTFNLSEEGLTLPHTSKLPPYITFASLGNSSICRLTEVRGMMSCDMWQANNLTDTPRVLYWKTIIFNSLLWALIRTPEHAPKSDRVKLVKICRFSIYHNSMILISLEYDNGIFYKMTGVMYMKKERKVSSYYSWTFPRHLQLQNISGTLCMWQD